jgi:hypothetical protein
MTSVVIACLSCAYLLIFAPLVLRSITQLQTQRVIFFNWHEGALRARQLTGNAATTFAGTQLVGRIIILGGVLMGLLQTNINLIILSTLAGLAIGATATAIGEREAVDVPSGESGVFFTRFTINADNITPVREIQMQDDQEREDLIDEADYRELGEDSEKPKNSPSDD